MTAWSECMLYEKTQLSIMLVYMEGTCKPPPRVEHTYPEGGVRPSLDSKKGILYLDPFEFDGESVSQVGSENFSCPFNEHKGLWVADQPQNLTSSPPYAAAAGGEDLTGSKTAGEHSDFSWVGSIEFQFEIPHLRYLKNYKYDK